MELILLKGIHRNLPPNSDLFWDVKTKNGDIGEKKNI